MVRLTAVNSPTPGRDVLDAARTAFPELAWERADFPEQGLDHHVAVLSGVSGVPGASDPTVVARLAIAPGVVGRADLEAGVLAAIAERAPARVPRALATDGGSLTLATHVAGYPLTEEVWDSLDDGPRETLAADLAGTLDVVHHLGDGAPSMPDVGSSWFPVKHEKLTRAVDEHVLPILGARDADAARAIMAEAEATFIDEPVPPRLIHGDLHETHLRWDGDRRRGRLGLIDFSDMTLADPAIDVAHLAGISPELHARVISDLAAADPDLERRAAIYSRWDAVFLMADHLTTGRTPETTARALFGRALESVRGRRAPWAR